MFYWVFRELYAVPRASVVDVVEVLLQTSVFYCARLFDCDSQCRADCTKDCRFMILEDVLDFKPLVQEFGLGGKSLRIHGGGVGSRCVFLFMCALLTLMHSPYFLKLALLEADQMGMRFPAVCWKSESVAMPGDARTCGLIT